MHPAIKKHDEEQKEIKRISELFEVGMKLKIKNDIFTITKIENDIIYTNSSMPPVSKKDIAECIVTGLPAKIEIL